MNTNNHAGKESRHVLAAPAWKRTHTERTYAQTSLPTQQTVCQDDKHRVQLAYWQQQLKGLTTIPFLERDEVGSEENARPFTVSTSLTDALGKLANQEDVPLYAVLLATFSTLLYRYTNHEDIAIGTPVTNQNGTNRLIVRANVKGDMPFLDLLHTVKSTTLAAYAHQDVPFEQMAESLQPEGKADYSSLYQVFFVLQNSFIQDEQDVRGEDLSLIFHKEETTLIGQIDYNRRLFTVEAITRMQHHLLTLLQAIVDEPTKRVAVLPLLADAERHHLLIEKNETSKAFRFDVTLPELFAEQVKKTPDDIAVTFGDTCLSYKVLDEKVTQLAAHLRAKQVKPGAVIGLLLPRSVDMVVALLGVLKAGGTYVPIDPDYPEERITYMLRDSGITLILSTASMDVPLTEGLERINVDDTLCNVYHEQVWTYMHHLDDKAYIIYTSGSTGQPKGVMISHRAVTNFVYGITELLPFQPGERIASVATMSFDLSLLETIVPLTIGMQVAIADIVEQTNPAHFHQFIRRNEIDWLQFTPSRLQMMWGDGSTFSQMKGMIIGAEPLSRALLDKVSASFPGDIYHLYGPTEATIWTSGCLLDPTAPVDLGRPLGNTEMYVLDSALAPVPIGIAGELYIGGLGLADGYVNRLAQTKEAFIPHPFKNGQRLYKTGDVARYLEDGTLQFLGRKDAQVKIRGFRIELYEVEHALRAHPAVQAAVVLDLEDATYEKQLVGYIVPTSGVNMSMKDVRTFMQKRLPAYMVPTLWVRLDELPLTPNGKVDRKALPAPNTGKARSKQTQQEPSTPVEIFIVEVLETLLAADHIGLHDNFLDIGGHSLRMAQLSSRIEKQYNISTTLQDIFAHPNVYELAWFITEKQADMGEKAHVDTRVDGRVTDLVDTMSEEEIETMLNMLLEEGARDE